MRPSAPFHIPLAVLLAFLLASAASAVEVREVLWGFDGRAVPGRFNPLSVFLENPSSAAFDGNLTLYHADALGKRVGANIVEPCYLAPHTGRWVQFQAYVLDDAGPWFVAWGPKEKERAELPTTRLGPPAQVILREAEALSQETTSLKSLPENLFPACAGGAEALHSVLLDHVPRWAPARRQAFLDWVYGGGKVHLLMDESGQWPVFREELSPLNSPAVTVRIGAGSVVKHMTSLKGMTEGFLSQREFAPPELAATYQAAMGKPEVTFFTKLMETNRPHHNWALIYFMVAAYIAVIGPVNYFLARKAAECRRTILFFIAAVGCFAFLFHMVGRRGVGETGAVHTLSYARPLASGQWDVTQWSNVFVLTGAYYTVSHPCTHNLYATGQDFEAINGVIHNGAGGAFSVDIPSYSSRSVLHRGKFAGPRLALKVAEWREQEKLEAFALEGTPPDGMIGAWVYYRGKICPMTRVADRLRAEEEKNESVNDFASLMGKGYSRWAVSYLNDSPASNLEAEFRDILPSLVRSALGVPGAYEQAALVPSGPPGQAQVLIAARAPAAFNMARGRFGPETGYVLYHLTFFKSEN